MSQPQQTQPQTPTHPRVLAAVEHDGSNVVSTDALASAQNKEPPNRRVLFIVTIIALIAIIAGGRMWWHSHFYVETENAYIAGHVHPVSARVAGVVTKVFVNDNQDVRIGDAIAELDPTDQHIKIEQIVAQIETAKLQALQADAQVAQVRAQADGAIAHVAQSSAQLQRAKQDAERYGQLYTAQMKAVSKAELDGVNAVLAGATADQAARRDGVVAAQAQITAAQSSREVIKAQIKVLQVQLKDAQQQLSYNRILAPVSGRIGKRSIEVGMRVQPGQQLAAIVQENIWVTANFKETQLASLQPGQTVKIMFDAMPGQPLTGHIESLAPASGAQFSLLPTDNATGNFTKIVQRVPVKIALLAEDIRRLNGRLVPGMSALVEIELNQPMRAQENAPPPTR